MNIEFLMLGTGTEVLLVAAIMGVVGTGVSAYAQAQAAGAQEDAAKANAQIAENNAQAAEQQSAYEAERIRARNRKIVESQKAQYSASGLLISGGSASDVIYDSSVQGELDALASLYKGKVQANAQRSQASLDRATASSTAANAPYMIGGTVLGGLGSAAQSYGRYKAEKKVSAKPIR